MGRRGDTEFRGHARRGASGALYSQSALARLNSPLRAVIQMTRGAHAMLMFGSRATKASEPRQVRKGSNDKECPSGATGEPGLSRVVVFAHMASGSRGGAWPLSPLSARGSVGMSTRRARTERPRLNKALGQHLLVSDGVLDDIIEAAELSADEVVVEVGPGTGLLTRRLLGAAGQVVAVEIDPAMVAHIRETLSDNENLTLVEGDIREQRPEGLTDGKPYIVVAKPALLCRVSDDPPLS